MSDAQKRGAVRRSKAAMSDSQKARTGTPSTTSSKKDITFKEAFRQGLKDRREGKGMNFTWRGKSYAAVTQDEIDKAQKAGKIKEYLESFLKYEKEKEIMPGLTDKQKTLPEFLKKKIMKSKMKKRNLCMIRGR